MDTSLQEMLRDALLANSYDYDSMKLSLKKTWENSFSYLYVLENSYIGYEEFHYISDENSHRELKTVEEIGYRKTDYSYYLKNMTGGYQHFSPTGIKIEKDIVTLTTIHKYLKDGTVSEETFNVDRYLEITNVSGNLYTDRIYRAYFNCDYNFIHVCNRKEYRLSKYYQNEFTFMDMVNNPSIFYKVPILLIDGRVIYDYKMHILTENNVQFILPYGDKFVYDGRDPDDNRRLFASHTIDILIVDNIYYERIKELSNKNIVRSSLNMNSVTRSIKIPKSWFSNITSGIRGMIGQLFCSLHYTDGSDANYELGTSLLHMEDYDSDNYICYLSKYEYAELQSHSTPIYISIIFLHRLHYHEFYTGKKYAEWSGSGDIDLALLQKGEKQPYEAPIPVENILLMKMPADGRDVILNHNESIKLYYPNIYTISDDDKKTGDRYKLFYFYYDIKGFKYFLLQSFYYALLNIINPDLKLEEALNKLYHSEYTSGTDEQVAIQDYFWYMMKYIQPINRYGEIDYINHYILEEENQDKIPWNYFEETLKKWIRIEPFVLRDYVIQQETMNKCYHMFTKNIDLSDRLRTDTSIDMDGNIIAFDEPMYAFALSNNPSNPNMLQIRVFVDGIMAQDVEQFRWLYLDYIYIPTRYVTNNSLIEVEVFPTYSFYKDFKFSSINDVETIILAEPEENIKPTLADIYFRDHDLDLRYDDTFFDVTISFKEGDYDTTSLDPEKPVVFTHIYVIKIAPTSEEVVGKDIQFCLNKKPNGMRIKTVDDGYPYFILTENEFRYDIEYIRIFRNGRLVPRSKYLMYCANKYPVLILFEECAKGESIYIDITPYRYKEIYYQERLSKDTTLIDLRGIITKPFDIRYYDVYLNGRRLTFNNVFTITPWEITLCNIHSDYSLLIYEKDRDWEYFGLNYKENIYYFSPDDILNNDGINQESKNELIKTIIDGSKDPDVDIYPNDNTEDDIDTEEIKEEIIEAMQIAMFYYNELLPHTYVNPDELQFSEAIIRNIYPIIHDTYFTEPNTSDQPEILYLDPDITIDTSNKDAEIAPEDMTSVLYEVGHLEEVDSEILNGSIGDMTKKTI